MEFALTPDQVALRSAVRDLIAAHAGPGVVRAVVDDPEGDGDPPGLWERMAAQGWTALLVPQEHDGLGLGLLDAAVIARCLGAGLVPGPFLPTLLGGEAIRRAGDPDQLKAWLPLLAAGQVRLAVAFHDDGPDRGDDGPDSGEAVTADGDVLGGTARFVEYAHLADRIVVGTHDGLWLVDPAQPGVRIDRTPVLDRTARPAVVSLDGVTAERLPAADAATVAELVARAAALYANDLVGIAREALTRTVDYVRTREQFGRPVGSFQAIKHHLADLDVAVTMAEHAGWYAAHALDEGLPDALLAVSIAKAKAGDAAGEATAKMIQYHGGIGYTWEHEAHLFFKRAGREQHAYGDPTAHRERIARLVVDPDGHGA